MFFIPGEHLFNSYRIVRKLFIVTKILLVKYIVKNYI